MQGDGVPQPPEPNAGGAVPSGDRSRGSAETHFARFQERAAELRAGPLQFSRLREKVARCGEVLEPIVEADPYLDVVRWRGERDLFKWRPEQTIADFQAFAEAGLVNEVPQ